VRTRRGDTVARDEELASIEVDGTDDGAPTGAGTPIEEDRA
jgi:hypothetical protein